MKNRYEREDQGLDENRLMEEAQKFIDGKKSKEEYQIWSHKNKNCEFTIDLGNDIKAIFTNEIYNLREKYERPYIIKAYRWQVLYKTNDQKDWTEISVQERI